jgi:protein-S-isoprenylcysteine O-methyltransferase Ste14
MSLIPTFKIGVWNAWLFMSVFILQMLVIMFARKRVSERSHVPAEARKTLLERYTGNVATFVWLAALGYSIFLPLQLGTIWFYIGLFVFTIGLILITAATFIFISAGPDQLITTGVYRYSRHPVYLATFLIFLSAGIVSLSMLFICFSVILAFCLHKEALIEERYCAGKHRGDYQKYMNDVPRWIGLPKRIA